MQKNIADLTDEQILYEFVKRFKCDGAILIYVESNIEVGFGRWKNADGRKWVNRFIKNIKNSSSSNSTFLLDKECRSFNL
ncbi:MAG: hypothetical protein LKI39_01005 [Bacteroides sp.]|jgi:hypothetical protein|nr:hypothetical protein [Bacteroides sp.]MCI1681117.1 hypothetical protein [Bacteroides sp.]